MKRKMSMQKVYVKVDTSFDPTGYMFPTAITWSDGRTFKIDRVQDYRPAFSAGNKTDAVCYTVWIHGKQKQLFFEESFPHFSLCPGRWYVETNFESYAKQNLSCD